MGNSRGLLVNGCYVEIKTFPTRERPGFALYHDVHGTVDKVTYSFNFETHVFDAHRADELGAPVTGPRFTMTPVLDDAGDIDMLEVRFDNLPGFVGTLVWDDSGDESEGTSPAVDLLQLTAVQ